MDRKKFIKKSILGTAGIVAGQTYLTAMHNGKTAHSTYDKLLEQVGFNHIPNKEVLTMKSVLHKANSRGKADHGWLQSNHSFSFANYYNPQRMNFGVLRVLNDDIVAGGKGFNTHPHDNMEIISIPLEGDLEHKDSIGNIALIKKGDVQVMSAGTGVYHSEYNNNRIDYVKFLQIWIFPDKKDVSPRYDQISLDQQKMNDSFLQILSPDPEDEGVWIHQNAWFHLGDFKKDSNATYRLKDKTNGVYAFIISGDVTIAGQALNERDGYGLWETDRIDLVSDSDSRVLLMEVPMNL